MEEGPDPLAKTGIEDVQHDPQIRVELLCAQRAVQVSHVILLKQRERAGRADSGVTKRLVGQGGPFDDPDVRQLGDPRAVVALLRRHDHRDVFGVPGGQFLDDAEGE